MLAIATLCLLGCASVPEPHDASVAQHEASAKAQDKQATEHAAQFDPNASASRSRCGRSEDGIGEGGACWTSKVNPTKEHLAMAEDHHRLAALHRSASQALRDAEMRACSGVFAEDRDLSPFEHREDVASVEEITIPGSGKTPVAKLVGARITFRALPGMTSEWLQRVVDCHMARNAALGHDVPEMPSCPLVPNGVRANVKSGHGGFDVEVVADDSTTAQEVLKRARSLTTR